MALDITRPLPTRLYSLVEDTMDKGHILVIADTAEAADHLGRNLLPRAGYQATVADALTPSPPCDAVLVDITHLRSGPLAGLQAQRRMGNEVPAIVCAPRLTDEMSSQIFLLDIRDFVPKPVEDTILLERLDQFVSQMRRERDVSTLAHHLEQSQKTLARRLDEMSALSRIGRAIASLTSADAVLTRIVEAAVYLTHADEGVVYLLEEANTLRLRAFEGLTDKQAAAIEHPSPESDVAVVLASGQPIARGAGDAGSLVTPDYVVRAALNVPIVVQHRAAGVLAVHSHTERTFEQADQAVLTNLADYAAIALDKMSLIARANHRIDAALAASRTVRLHAETLLSPVDGIVSQIDTLLSGGFGRLTEAQHSAMARIRLAAKRLQEIVGFIRETLADFDSEWSSSD